MYVCCMYEVSMYVCMYVCMYVFMSVCVHVCMYVYNVIPGIAYTESITAGSITRAHGVCTPYVCMYVSMYVCMYVRMYVCMYVCVYVCMYVCTFCSNMAVIGAKALFITALILTA